MTKLSGVRKSPHGSGKFYTGMKGPVPQAAGTQAAPGQEATVCTAGTSAGGDPLQGRCGRRGAAVSVAIQGKLPAHPPGARIQTLYAQYHLIQHLFRTVHQGGEIRNQALFHLPCKQLCVEIHITP